MKIAGIQLPPLLAKAARECRTHIVAAALFSLGVNLLYLAAPIYMLQVYDRVVPTGGVATLGFITLALAVALVSLSMLDSIRLRLLVRASIRLDNLVTPRLLQRAIGGSGTPHPRAECGYRSGRPSAAHRSRTPLPRRDRP